MVAQRRELAQLLETAQEEERRRIAADIHDDPIQVMSAVDMRLQLLLARPERSMRTSSASWRRSCDPRSTACGTSCSSSGPWRSTSRG